MFCSAIIREDPAFFRDTQLGNVQGEKDIEIVNLKWDISVKSLASRLRILCRNGIHLMGTEDAKEALLSTYWHTCELTETPIAFTEPKQVQARVRSSAERRKWVPSPYLTVMLSAIDRHSQRKN